MISVFKCKDQVCGDKPGNAIHFTGLNYSSYTIKFHKVPPGGDKHCTGAHARPHKHRGTTEDCWMGRGRSLVESSLQDALEREGDKLEALARVELVLELDPERNRQKFG